MILNHIKKHKNTIFQFLNTIHELVAVAWLIRLTTDQHHQEDSVQVLSRLIAWIVNVHFYKLKYLKNNPIFIPFAAH